MRLVEIRRLLGVLRMGRCPVKEWHLALERKASYGAIPEIQGVKRASKHWRRIYRGTQGSDRRLLCIEQLGDWQQKLL
ncbi:MAG: hypothetical protein H7833_12395 [Magnetococcus sp. DMHC-1]|nr:hypothetical protein [Magnetococcales bacterium]